jgi:hypothetical protein
VPLQSLLAATIVRRCFPLSYSFEFLSLLTIWSVS